MQARCAVLLSVLAIPFSDAIAQMQTIVRVDGNNGSANPANEGDGWGSDAYLYLTDGLEMAADLKDTHDTAISVWVARATYRPDQHYPEGETDDRDESFELTSRVLVYGGFVGSETELGGRNVLSIVPTVLSGEIGGGGLSDNSRTIVLLSAVGHFTRLDGFTIEDGYSESGTGAGAKKTDDEVHIVNCTFQGNYADSGGGGLDLGSGQGEVPDGYVVNCVFKDNEGDDGGAVLQGQNSYFEYHNCLFADNTADAGGAVHLVPSNYAIFKNCTIADNYAATAGGGVYVDATSEIGAAVDIFNSILWDNSTSGGSGQAAQISLDVDATCTCEYSDVKDFDFMTPLCSGDEFSNIDEDPDFQSGTYELLSSSPCINVASADAKHLPFDFLDVDDDEESGSGKFEPTPDLNHDARIYDFGPDMGAFEESDCPNICGASGVDYSDLLCLLGNWGECPDPPETCPSDLTGDDEVTFVDLLILLAVYGCPSGVNENESITTVFSDAGIGDAEWGVFMDCFTNGDDEETKNCACWLEHYLQDCLPSCQTLPDCEGDDPLENH